MQEAKCTSVPVGGQFILSREQCPANSEEVREMRNVPYSMALGCLMYLMVSTRPGIAHALSILCRFMSNPGVEHWKALKWLLRYLKGTWDYGLVYKREKEKLNLKGFVDADYASRRDTRRSTIAYMFMTNSNCIC
ncbi:secreted RxLR effector protein 161-like [Humulus lupulus]|uniref:secreted RxLR effector protein 161-like n=1 Tax=Humulus lupulus TaxID=3486 RepID=UPI002B41328A|nr:secreted RxLR effector protein 161-like [Humulus lupulus]